MRYNRDIQNIPLGKYAVQFDRFEGDCGGKNRPTGTFWARWRYL